MASKTNYSTKTAGMLSPYRVLDLTENGCMYAGKLLGDLGADVVKVEKPGGSPSRSNGPFWHDDVHPERSLFWLAYNSNKRSITLDLESTDGVEIFKQLAKTADFVLESFPPDYMKKLGLGYDELERINPGIIVAAITPFGQTGPKANNAWCDMSVWSSGGPTYLTGHPDRPPVSIGFAHQATLHGGAEAAAACMIALSHREKTGEGQFIDVSMQECSYWVITSWQEFWETTGTIPKRQAGFAGVGRGHTPMAAGGARERRQLYPCKDGFIMYTVQGGTWGGATSSSAVVEWMNEEGMAPKWLLEFDWVRGFDLSNMNIETLDALEEVFLKFFMGKTKLEITDRSVQGHFMVGPVNTLEDVATYPHLQARGFFREIWHKELRENVTYCGPAVVASETPMNLRLPAPLIGEHNNELLTDELGFNEDELVVLMHAGII